jgi:hypothetical protein
LINSIQRLQIAKERVDETEKEVKIARENCLYQLKRFIDTYGWDETARKGCGGEFPAGYYPP